VIQIDIIFSKRALKGINALQYNSVKQTVRHAVQTVNGICQAEYYDG